MIDKLFTFGCSFTRDNYQQTWADLLAAKYNLRLTNQAERGCGADYISKRIMISDGMDPADSLIVIMWPCADRFDLWADSTVPHLLDDVVYASWPDGTTPMLVDLYGNRNQNHGYILNGSIPRGFKHYYYKYFYSCYQAVHDWYGWIIQTQLYLKSKGYRFLMMSGWPLLNPLQYHLDQYKQEKKIFDNIDLQTFAGPALHLGFYQWCKQQKLDFFDTHHPATAAHAQWLESFIYAPVEKLLASPTSFK